MCLSWHVIGHCAKLNSLRQTCVWLGGVCVCVCVCVSDPMWEGKKNCSTHPMAFLLLSLFHQIRTTFGESDGDAELEHSSLFGRLRGRKRSSVCKAEGRPHAVLWQSISALLLLNNLFHFLFIPSLESHDSHAALGSKPSRQTDLFRKPLENQSSCFWTEPNFSLT